MNPLRAKVVTDLKELNRYSYCGHSALMGKKKREWQDIEYVLGFFGKRIGEARKKYRSYSTFVSLCAWEIGARENAKKKAIAPQQLRTSRFIPPAFIMNTSKIPNTRNRPALALDFP